MIRGVELVDFMSYEHAYVPLRPGLNIVCGPNGAGKSTILLAISLVLGQSHTERGRKLTDLIRWGKDEARVALTMDNTTRDGEKLFPDVRGETFTLTRVLTKQGQYGWLVNDFPLAKKELLATMNKLGAHPDNLFIIMHQLMVHKFATVSGPDKLRMLEEAIGFQSYRQDAKEALSRLHKAGDEERALNAVLESTRETYDYWSREYEKYRHKRSLEERVRVLDAELAWAKVQQREAAVKKLEDRLDSLKTELAGLDERITLTGRELADQEDRKGSIVTERSTSETKRVAAAKELGGAEAESRLFGEFAKKLEGERREIESRLRDAETRAKGALERQLLLDDRLAALDREFDDVLGHVIEAKVESEVLAFRNKILADEVIRVDQDLVAEREDLDLVTKDAKSLGPKVEPRKNAEVHAERNKLLDELKPLSHLSPEVEKMYNTYAKNFDEIRGQAAKLVENRKAIESDVKERTVKWRATLEELLEKVNVEFNTLIKEAGGRGFSRLVNGEDVEKAGLEILVGYRGQEPVGLDTMSQSGGERSAALMAFLLALQRRIESPFRAVDEFDVHLDPRNRELVTTMIVKNGHGLPGVQYVAITPGPVAPPEGVNVIVVQSVSGTARVGQVVVR